MTVGAVLNDSGLFWGLRPQPTSAKSLRLNIKVFSGPRPPEPSRKLRKKLDIQFCSGRARLRPPTNLRILHFKGTAPWDFSRTAEAIG